jgi:hypothetical protein
LIDGLITTAQRPIAGVFLDSYTLSGTGLFTDIEIRNYQFNTVGPHAPVPAIQFGKSTVDRFKVRGMVARNVTMGSQNLIQLLANSTTRNLSFEDVTVIDSNGVMTVPPVMISGGTHESIDFINNRWDRGTQATLAQPYVSMTGATVNRVRFVGGFFDRCSNMFAQSGGTLSNLSTIGFSHTNAGGGSSVAQTAGTLSRLRAGNDTALLASGTIGSKKTDGTEDT